MSFTRAMRFGFPAAVLAVVLTASPAQAQVAVTGGLDFVNLYNFRGIGQNNEGMSIWPFVDLGGTVFTGDGGLKTVGVNVGSWNALHTEIDGFTNRDGEVTDNKWYESDIYGTVAFGFSQASLGVTYTSYTSPANLFAHVKELAVKGTYTGATGAVTIGPYALVAFELSDDGQADAGSAKGTYVELGVAPSFAAGPRATLAIPVKLGLSASDYYEFGTGEDSTFGYFSVAGLVTVPVGGGANIHGGVEYQAYGDTVKAYNAFRDPTDPSDGEVIASIGLGFSF